MNVGIFTCSQPHRLSSKPQTVFWAIVAASLFLSGAACTTLVASESAATDTSGTESSDSNTGQGTGDGSDVVAPDGVTPDDAGESMDLPAIGEDAGTNADDATTSSDSGASDVLAFEDVGTEDTLPRVDSATNKDVIVPDATCEDDDGCETTGDYCQSATGACGGGGKCQPTPEDCPAVFDPVCGCDGKNYGNPCTAAASGINVAKQGPCVDLCANYVQPACIESGCLSGETCETSVGCVPSSCSCDSDTGAIGCTEDCGGGTCVPDVTPTCCNPSSEPGVGDNPFCFEGHGCCPDGSWACSIGDGMTFSCDGELINNPEGEACDACCPLGNKPGEGDNPPCIEGASCCGSGAWACNTGSGQSTCDVLGVQCDDADLCSGYVAPGCVQSGCLSGETCDTSVGCNPSSCTCNPDNGLVGCTKDCGGGTCVPDAPAQCCNPETQPGVGDNPFCFEGHGCCPDGSWACSIGDGMTFSCDGELIKNPVGEACDACCDLATKPGTPGNKVCLGSVTCCGTGAWTCDQLDGQTSCDVVGVPCSKMSLPTE
jgi:hypothetical protein